MRLPAFFFGHGNPMHAIADNAYTRAWSRIGASVRKPRAVLCVSAHWYVPDSGVTIAANPRTIHDFGGFPQPLYEVMYPAPGEPALARRVQQMLAPLEVRLDDDWGLDHGTWSVLRHVFPAADVPVVQLSIDERQPAAFHFEIGRKLAALRDEGVLVVGSGNVVHNLRTMRWEEDAEPYDWALRFDSQARDAILSGDFRALVEYRELGPDGRLAIPTPDHYLPLLYVLGTAQSDDAASFPVEGFDLASVSMRAVEIGASAAT